MGGGERVAHLLYGGNMWSACACQVGQTPLLFKKKVGGNNDEARDKSISNTLHILSFSTTVFPTERD